MHFLTINPVSIVPYRKIINSTALHQMQIRHCTCNLTLRHIHVIIAAVEKQ